MALAKEPLRALAELRSASPNRLDQRTPDWRFADRRLARAVCVRQPHPLQKSVVNIDTNQVDFIGGQLLERFFPASASPLPLGSVDHLPGLVMLLLISVAAFGEVKDDT